MVVTLGEKGSDMYFQNKVIHIPSRKPAVIKDPTGCGDAYRAGFLAEIQHEFPKLTPGRAAARLSKQCISIAILERAGKLVTKLAFACLKSLGTQNHKFHGQSAA